ncbi:MAG: hypothetical protein ACOX0U_06055 [Oscillospiraceae bacterium]
MLPMERRLDEKLGLGYEFVFKGWLIRVRCGGRNEGDIPQYKGPMKMPFFRGFTS